MRFLVILCLLIVGGSKAHASEIAVHIRLDKASYWVGDTLKIRIAYQNASGRLIRFLPEPEARYADAIILREPNGRKVGKVIPFGEMSMDFRGLSEDIVLLRPGQTCSRTLEVKIGSTLPPSYGNNKRGLFMWFHGSSTELPHYGRYQLTAKYRCSPNHPVGPYVVGLPKLWSGEAESNPIFVEFKIK